MDHKEMISVLIPFHHLAYAVSALSNLAISAGQAVGEIKVAGTVQHDHFADVVNATLLLLNGESTLDRAVAMALDVSLTGTPFTHWEMTTRAVVDVQVTRADHGKYFAWRVFYAVKGAILEKTSPLTLFDFYAYFQSMLHILMIAVNNTFSIYILQ